jgi:hypothetical protein
MCSISLLYASPIAAASVVPALPARLQLRHLELSDAGLLHLPDCISRMAGLEVLVARRLGMERTVGDLWQPKTDVRSAAYRYWARVLACKCRLSHSSALLNTAACGRPATCFTRPPARPLACTPMCPQG